MTAEQPKRSLDDIEADAAGHQDAPPGLDARNASDRPALVSEVSSCIVGIAMVGLAAAVVLDAGELRPANEPLGPAFFPTLIGIGLALVGGLLVFSARNYVVATFRDIGNWSLDKNRIAGIVVILVTMVLAALLMPVVGFWLVGTVIYAVSALVLQAPPSWRIPAIGATLSGLIVLLFDRLIDLSLPAGPWGF